MSDPFANLLQSLKQGTPPQNPKTLRQQQQQQQQQHVSGKESQTSTNTTGNNTVQGNGNFGITVDNLHIASAPLVPSRSVSPTVLPTKQGQTSIHDDLEELFGLSNTKTSIDQQDHEQKQEQKRPEVVVDEVKDMELAQLMALGLSFEKALDYYDSGVSYEDLLQAKRERQQYAKAQLRRRDESPGQPHQHDTGGSLFSIAANLFNKGKELVDQLTAYPEDTDRLTKYAHMYNYEDSSSEHNRSDTSLAKSKRSDRFEMKKAQSPAVDNRAVASSSQFNESNEVDLLDDNHNVKAKDTPLQEDLLDSTDIKCGDTISNTDGQSKDEAQKDILLDFTSTGASGSRATFPATAKGVTIPRVAVSHIELSGYEEFNKRAKAAFVKGDYIAALDNYTKSLNTLPQRHPLRIIALSNMIITQIKVGDYTECIENAKKALELYPSGTDTKRVFSYTIQDSNPARTYGEIWSKIMLRQAEVYEHQESYKLALATYQKLLENGFHDQKVMAGKNRCQKVISPTPTRTASTPVVTTSTTTTTSTDNDDVTTLPRSRPRQTDFATPSSTSVTSVAAQNVKAANIKALELEKQRLALHDKVQDKINAWENNKQDDIRYLLANLQQVLTWADWKPVLQTDLVMPKRVKVTYLKAMAKVHPDKLGQSLDLESRMVAENVFSALSTAWEKFKVDNNIN